MLTLFLLITISFHKSFSQLTYKNKGKNWKPKNSLELATPSGFIDTNQLPVLHVITFEPLLPVHMQV